MTQGSEASFRTADEAARVPLQVGAWQVAPDLNQIARGDLVVAVEPKVMALLVLLAGRPGEVVSRDDLLAAVWPGVVVGDNALTQVVIKLRKALGDTAREPTYVQAIAKKGYRLIASVAAGIGATTVGAPSPHSPHRPAPPAPPAFAQAPARLRARTWWLAGALATVGVVIVAAYLSTAGPSVTAARQEDRDSSVMPPTVAVRPFDEIDAGPDPAGVARAISADLMTDLSKVSGIRVINGVGQPTSGVAGEPPRYVLTGTVQHEGDRLRLNVLLTEAATGRPVWSERYERRITDLFTLQDELVKSILKSLPVQVSDAESRRIAWRNTRNLQAWEQFVRAQAALLVRRPEQNEAARSLYWDAVRLDPEFARAYAGLAMTYALQAQQGWVADTEGALARADELALTAVKMNPDLPEAHWVLAFVHAQRREHDAALREVDRALRLNPSNADAYALKAGIETYLGRPSESVALLRLAQRLNPDGGSLYYLLLGRAYYFLDYHEQARLNLGQALERNAENLEARIYLAASLWHKGDADGARWQVDEIHALEPAFRIDDWLSTYPLTDPAERQRLREGLVATGLSEPSPGPIR